MLKKLIIVLVGLNLSGKDTVADFLQRKDFIHYSLSDILRDICRRRKSYKSREDLIRIGNELRQRYGHGYLASQAIKKADRLGQHKLVISSVRNPGEINELKKHGTLFVIEVTAPIKVRFKRAKNRGKIDDKVTFSQFLSQEKRERQGQVHQQQLDKVISLADYKINNSSTRQVLFKRVDQVLQRILKKVKMDRILNIIILGPQGSGKGTQAVILAEKFNLVHFETGKIFRKLARQRTVLGRKINYLINKKGRLIPANFVVKVLKSELLKIKSNKGLVFDGYPRNLTQAKALDRLFKVLNRQLTHVFYMPISRRSTIKRLVLRRTCQKCGRVFIKGVNINSNARYCPVCQGKIYQREDDKPKAIARRLAIYNKLTKPVIEFYKKKGVLIKVNGEPPIKSVARAIMKYLK